jgi:oxygen-independent coproporphyrinogen-3 oxidase
VAAPFPTPDSATLRRVADALASVPRSAYSVPHVYPSAAPAYTEAPLEERPAPAAEKLRLYVHVPFCRYHCTFCYFAVRIGASAETMARYVRALGAELEATPPGAPLSQLFVGGGTPTSLPAELLDELLETVFRRHPPVPGNVHTLETSPETISPAHIAVLRRRGVGRVSMGIQSLDSDVLGTVHRQQTSDGALSACELLVDSGLILNVDLIYGLPGQREESFLHDLDAIAERGVPSFTAYSLRVNERTPVAKVLDHGNPFDLAGLMRWRAFVQRSAEERGYTQTRWHTFKRLDTIAATHERLPCFDDDMSGYQLGIGMSARSHLGYTVYRNHEQLPVYLKRVEAGQSPVEQVFRLDEDDRKTQAIARSLGDGRPLPRADYERIFGRPIDADFGEVLASLRAGGLLEDDGATLVLSELGRLVYDLVTLAFYPRRAQEWLTRRERASFVQIAAPANVA